MCTTGTDCMRILGHIHTLNDEDVIDRSLQALLDQTHPLDEIVLVDNGSTDGTLERPFPNHVTVIRHTKNLGTSGAVITGFQYALDNNYDWIWVFDADSAPHRDALEKLFHLYESLPSEVKAQTRMLATLPLDSTTGRQYHGIVFSRRGAGTVAPEAGQAYYEFDGAMWTGCLFKVEAIRQIGLPPADYVLDWGEYEYGYRGQMRGWKAFMHVSSILDHNIGGQTSMGFVTYRIGPLSFRMFELPAFRCYYLVRNTLYFWLHEYHVINFHTLLPSFVMISLFIANFLLRPMNHGREIRACLRGIRDGLFKKMSRRY
jgi:GT2 family glycosyltransferase